MAWIIYLAGVADGVRVLFAASGAVALGVAFFCFMHGAIDQDPPTTAKGVRAVAAGFLIALIAVMIPSTTTIYMMVGANIAETQIADSENQELFGKVRQLVSQKLDEALDAAK